MAHRLRTFICPFCHIKFSSRQSNPLFCSGTCARKYRYKDNWNDKNIEYLFMKKIIIGEDPETCWKWLARKDKGGYGTFRYKGKMMNAHRVSYIIFNGEIPESLHVLHKCNNPSCNNPKHLKLGTNIDNVRDKVNSGNQTKGEKNKFAKLTEIMVKNIRDTRKSSYRTYKSIAEEFNVSRETVNHICTGRTWKHVK